MKGLLIKDWKLIKNQKTFITTMIALSVFFLSSNKNMQFGFTYLAVMAALLTANTIAYDEQNNGMGYLFTLPINRKHYVLEKYMFGAVSLGATLCASSAILLLFYANGRILLTPKTFLTLLLSAVLSAAVIMSVIIPIQLKFGSEKTRIALLILVAGIMIIGYGILQLAKTFSIDLSVLGSNLEQAGSIAVSIGIFLLAVGMLAVSYFISAAIMKRKQF